MSAVRFLFLGDGAAEVKEGSREMVRQDERPRHGGVPSVDRVLDLLEAVMTSPEDLSAKQLSRATGLPYATVHRLLATLARRGYVRQDPATKTYSLGPRLVVAATHASRLFGRWVRPFLADLVEASGETANVAILDDGHVVYIAQVQSRHQLRMFTEVGNRVLPHATAVGKVLLAFMPRDDVRDILQRNGLPPRTPNTITDLERFLRELDVVASQGFAYDDQEGELGVRCVAVPVFGAGASMAAMSISGPAGRLGNAERARVVPLMRQSAAAFGASLEAPDSP